MSLSPHLDHGTGADTCTNVAEGHSVSCHILLLSQRPENQVTPCRIFLTCSASVAVSALHQTERYTLITDERMLMSQPLNNALG
jgi:hypothetical protein